MLNDAAFSEEAHAGINKPLDNLSEYLFISACALVCHAGSNMSKFSTAALNCSFLSFLRFLVLVII